MLPVYMSADCCQMWGHTNVLVLSFNDGLRLIQCVLYSLLSPVVNFDRVKSEETIMRHVLHQSIHASHQLRYTLDQGYQTHFTFWATYSSI